MLSSRYLHLHEALGLGPMWLNKGAKVLPAETAAHIPQGAPQTPLQTTVAPQPAARTPAAATARLAATAAVKSAAKVSDGHFAHGRPPEKNIAAPVGKPSEPVLPETREMPSENTAYIMPLMHDAEIQPAAVMAVSICPAPEDSAIGRLFSGNTGVLLDNMLAAIGLKAADVHKTSWIKAAAVFTPEPPPGQMAAALPQMQAELAASRAQAILFLGQVFSQPHYAETIAQLCGSTPAFTVPHPARLLRQPHLKKQAWEELKKLRNILAAGAVPS
ncbi:uracil-DNA glycosylase family protein [Neisseria musculi]|uniref:Uracil DNA glycosylase superfamily protein n=1 Tax=Neisseria musculi TaxID=1815583 RepID=A0A7H1MD53_9NEIS|nr:uracil-DNA glycosylase family protein [Neisseria musculi]QNT59568.1 uracil DNA glycosylase superfamily protein [Neisseria musculi]